ncbi:MAG: hypothetical protein IPL08_09675 [Saprospiraceae bacterium]|nr:hypothetical protein [Saprospiraceae bacterium]
MQKATLKKAILQIRLMILNFDSTLFYNLSRNSGKTLLIGGWAIFSIWLVGRYLFVYDLELLAFIGFLWVYFGFFVGVLAIILLIIYIILNFNSLHFSIASTLLIILFNIPSVILILKLHNNIEKKSFVLFHNNTKIDGLKFNFVRGDSKKYIGELDIGESVMFNYEPKYHIDDARFYQDQEDLKLEIAYENGQTEIMKFPELVSGSCYNIALTEKFEINKKERIFFEIK